MTSPITLFRRVVMTLWIGLIVLVMLLVAISHVAPALGYQLIIVKGPSMEPAIPMGSLAFEQPVAAADLEPGMVVTYVLPTHAVVTHRITRIGDANGATLIETKGDANGAPDPAMHAAAGVTGLVHGHLPIAGYLLAFLAMPIGLLSALSFLGSLLMLAWLLEEFERDASEELDVSSDPDGFDLPAGRTVVGGGAGA